MIKKDRCNNKGFSLVELIVVILIMAIIAVALAPQVMKWVNNSKITADQNAAGVLKSAVQTAIADFQQSGTLAADSYTINGVASGLAPAGTEVNTGLGAKIIANLGGETYATKYNTAGFTIEVTATGNVRVYGGGAGSVAAIGGTITPVPLK